MVGFRAIARSTACKFAYFLKSARAFFDMLFEKTMHFVSSRVSLPDTSACASP